MHQSNIQIDLDEYLNKYMYKNTGKSDITNNVKNIVYYALQEENINIENVSVSIKTVSAEEIKDINREYRGIDRSTDVLSFPIFEKEELDILKNQDNKGKKLHEIELGDILLCLDIIKQHSIEYGTGIEREILYMITHGICHLLGYDHIKEEDKKEMRILEEKILSKIEVTE